MDDVLSGYCFVVVEWLTSPEDFFLLHSYMLRLDTLS